LTKEQKRNKEKLKQKMMLDIRSMLKKQQVANRVGSLGGKFLHKGCVLTQIEKN